MTVYSWWSCLCYFSSFSGNSDSGYCHSNSDEVISYMYKYHTDTHTNKLLSFSHIGEMVRTQNMRMEFNHLQCTSLDQKRMKRLNMKK